jgi:C4-type Zn-finger protein
LPIKPGGIMARTIQTIEGYLNEYHQELDDRKDGNLAANHFVEKVENCLRVIADNDSNINFDSIVDYFQGHHKLVLTQSEIADIVDLIELNTNPRGEK